MSECYNCKKFNIKHSKSYCIENNHIFILNDVKSLKCPYCYNILETLCYTCDILNPIECIKSKHDIVLYTQICYECFEKRTDVCGPNCNECKSDLNN